MMGGAGHWPTSRTSARAAPHGRSRQTAGLSRTRRESTSRPRSIFLDQHKPVSRNCHKHRGSLSQAAADCQIWRQLVHRGCSRSRRLSRGRAVSRVVRVSEPACFLRTRTAGCLGLAHCLRLPGSIRVAGPDMKVGLLGPPSRISCYCSLRPWPVPIPKSANSPSPRVDPRLQRHKLRKPTRSWSGRPRPGSVAPLSEINTGYVFVCVTPPTFVTQSPPAQRTPASVATVGGAIVVDNLPALLKTDDR